MGFRAASCTARSLELGPAVDAERAGGIGDVVRAAQVPGEHVVGRDVDHPGVGLCAGAGDVAGPAHCSPTPRQVGLGGVDVGERRAVDHHIATLHLPAGRIRVGDVEITVRQRADVIAPAGRLHREEPSHLAGRAGDQNPVPWGESGTPVAANRMRPRAQ